MTLEITVVSDFICPWCWLGKKRLDMALADSGLTEAADVTYWPFELNPDMPAEGMDRRAYRTAKFGSWEASQDLDARILEQAEADGVPFAFDRIQRTPNTRAAHRLTLLIQHHHRAQAPAFVDGVFRAYFVEGRDIGEASVLGEVAAAAGLDAPALLDRLARGEGDAAVKTVEDRLHASGVSGVPLFVIGGRPVHGAQPRDTLAAALRATADATG